jgi:hypothetical protein
VINDVGNLKQKPATGHPFTGTGPISGFKRSNQEGTPSKIGENKNALGVE